MRLYLDDDLDGNILIGLLQHAGHAVVSPRVWAVPPDTTNLPPKERKPCTCCESA